MSKNKKSKINIIDKLHKILDNRSHGELPSQNEKYFLSLKKRVKNSSIKDSYYGKILTKNTPEQEIDPLKPKVNIYPRVGIKIKEPLIPKEKEIPKPVEIEEKIVFKEREELSIEDEDVFEVEKLGREGPEFIEVQPLEIPKEEKKVISEEDLKEWEPVDKKEGEAVEELPTEFEVTKKEVFEEVPSRISEPEVENEVESPIYFCHHCGARLKGEGKFCGACGQKLVSDVEEKKEPITKKDVEQTYTSTSEEKEASEWEPIEIKEPEKEQIPTWEPIEEKPEEIQLPQEEPKIERETKIQAFKEIKNIDEKTAILLYDNGITNIEILKITSKKDLTKIKGIKRKTAKLIKKELEKKREWITIETLETEEKEQITMWEPIEEKPEEIQLPQEEPKIERETKIQAFKEIKNIDEKTAILLYDKGFTSTDSLKTATIKDLTKIKGIKRKTAKLIKKELKEISKPKTKKKKEKKVPKKGAKISKKPKIDKKPKLPETEEKIFKEEVEEILPTKKEKRKDNFKEIKTIDEKIAKLLIKNNIDTIEKLQNKTIKELVTIKGIKRKIAKEIKKELKNYVEKKNQEIFKESEEYKVSKDEMKHLDEDKISSKSKREIKVFRHKDFTLYEKTIEVPSGKVRTVRFFSKAKPEGAKPIELPKDFEVKVNKKTGVPYLRRKK